MIGQSVSMRRIMSLIERVASSDAPVLISGESGTGKEITARTIHELSRRKGRPFLAINCAAMPDTLVESQLFGHEKGAFTGADHRHPGLFERASGGTLLLDEITEMHPDTQAKLLRVLEEGTLLRLGATDEINVDVRVLAATNRRVETAIQGGRLREDLYYRLNVSSIHLPPLRDRREDLPLLVDHFMRAANEKHRRQVEGLDDECFAALTGYRWPGNIRELRNAVEHAVIFSDSRVLGVKDLPRTIGAIGMPDSSFTIQLGCSLREVTDELIRRTVAYVDGNKLRAAKILGITRHTIYSRLEDGDRPRDDRRPYRNGRDPRT
jgi:transcriptional regulator with PAS, ATPase and Fis domain